MVKFIKNNPDIELFLRNDDYGYNCAIPAIILILLQLIILFIRIVGFKDVATFSIGYLLFSSLTVVITLIFIGLFLMRYQYISDLCIHGTEHDCKIVTIKKKIIYVGNNNTPVAIRTIICIGELNGKEIKRSIDCKNNDMRFKIGENLTILYNKKKSSNWIIKKQYKYYTPAQKEKKEQE